MKKKFLTTVALAATMVVSSVFSAFAEDVDCTSGWWKQFSSGIEIDEDGVQIQFSTATAADAEYNWDTPSYVVYAADAQFAGGSDISETAGYTEYFVCRSDAYGWTSTATTADAAALNAAGVGFEADTSAVDWEAWLAANKEGVTCTITAARTGDDKVTVEITNGTVTSKATIMVDEDDTIYLSVTGELCTITDIATAKMSPSPRAAFAEIVFTTTTDDGTDDDNTGDSDSTGDNSSSSDNSASSSSDEATTAEVVEVTADVATAVAKAAVITNSDGEAVDVVLTVAVPEDEAVEKATSLVTKSDVLTKAGVSEFAVLDLTLTVDGTKVEYLGEDNKVNVTVPVSGIFEDIKEGSYVAVYRVDTIDDVDNLSYLGYSPVSSDKTISFTTDHFSTYVFAVVEDTSVLGDPVTYDELVPGAVPDIDSLPTVPTETETTTAGEDGTVEGDEDTGDTTPVMPLVVLAVIALGGVVAVMASKKRA